MAGCAGDGVVARKNRVEKEQAAKFGALLEFRIAGIVIAAHDHRRKKPAQAAAVCLDAGEAVFAIEVFGRRPRAERDECGDQ
jgi:hypothetical protein